MFTTFDLIFHFRQTSTKLTLAVNYKTEVFGKRMISDLLKNFDRILKAIADRPGELLSSVLNGCRSATTKGLSSRRANGSING
jgi:hypothetical protein